MGIDTKDLPVSVITPELENAIFRSGDARSQLIKNFQKTVGIHADGISDMSTKYAYGLVAKNGGIDSEIINKIKAFEALPAIAKKVDYGHLAKIEPSEFVPVVRKDGEKIEINSPFANRILPELDRIGKSYSRDHYKADYAGKAGAKVLAPYDGVVIDVQSKFMVYRTDNGLIVTDWHVRPLSGKAALKKGDSFKAGDEIARLGNQGNNGGYAPHLDRSYKQVSSGIYINPNRIHPDYIYNENEEDKLSERDKNAFYDKKTNTWIRADTLLTAGIDTESFKAIAENKALLASKTNTPPVFESPSTNQETTSIVVATPAAQPKPQPTVLEDKSAFEKVKQMFAKFNPEYGKTIVVQQTHQKLLPQEVEAAKFVQTALNNLGYAKIPDNELGHVAGGKTAAATKKFQEDNNLNKDGIVGSKTYAALEKQVMQKMTNNPEFQQTMVAMAEEYRARELEQVQRLAQEFKNAPKVAGNTARAATEHMGATPATDQVVSRA